MRNLKFSLPILLATGILAGCGGGGAAALKSGDVAVVGKVHVTKGDFAALLVQAQQSFKSQGRAFPKQGTTDYETIKGQAVLLLVQQAEREDKADSMGINVTDKDVQTRLDQIKKQYFGSSDAKYKADLKKQNLTDAQVREDIRQQLISEDIFDKVTKSVTVSDSAVDAYYKAHPTLYSQPEQRDVRYILVGKSKTTADSVYQQLKNGSSKTWCTLAKKYAKDASGQNCGKATFSKGQTVPVFDKIAFSAPANVVHAPFYDPTQYKSWFVVEPLGPVKTKSTTPEKQVASSIRQQLLQQKKNTTMSAWTKQLTKSFCSGSKVRYAVGYSASPDPCASTTTNSTTAG
jgi:hypothetical protein